MSRLRHIAFIMDGNGRWAKERGKPRNYGHRSGVKALKTVIEECEKIGLEAVSFYAFSTENWNRPKEERDKLFDMVRRFAETDLKKYSKRNIRTNFMGDLEPLPDDVKKAIYKVQEFTKNNTGMVVNIALNYGSRMEIVRAVNNILSSGVDKIEIDEFDKYLYSTGIVDPDIIVRTSGEKRLSNFMMYQAAYSELIFVDEYWPDFNRELLDRVIDEYYNRNRRFGCI